MFPWCPAKSVIVSAVDGRGMMYFTIQWKTDLTFQIVCTRTHSTPMGLVYCKLYSTVDDKFGISDSLFAYTFNSMPYGISMGDSRNQQIIW